MKHFIFTYDNQTQITNLAPLTENLFAEIFSRPSKSQLRALDGFTKIFTLPEDQN